MPPPTDSGNAEEPVDPRPGSALARELTTFLSRQPTGARHLLSSHVDDGTGHCRICSAGGQTGRLVWPCTIYLAAYYAVPRTIDREPAFVVLVPDQALP